MHKLLRRQLAKLDVTTSQLPSLEQWHQFLICVNRTYEGADQERYLLERSMVISSRELSDLNRKLQTAQQIAHLGYWLHDIATGENAWSQELYSMFGLDFTEAPPNINKITSLVHPEDKDGFIGLIESAFHEGKDYETDVRIKGFAENCPYRWYHIIAQPDRSSKKITRIFGVAMDIQQKKEIEEELKNLNQQLIASARRAGMAEVATALLHNIGNVLNSATVSIGLLQEWHNAIYFDKLFKLTEILQPNIKNFKNYVNQNPKAELLLEYINELVSKIQEVHQQGNLEINTVKKSIDHIKDITALQQNLSGVSAMIEKITLRGVIEDAVRLVGKQLKKNEIKIICHCGDESILTDKNKLLQILVNLLQNAKDALLASHNSPKTISITLNKKDANYITLTVTDNGVGIKSEDIGKLFTFGFTTKRSGHGYGLHSSAITAKELGGELKVASAGEGKGAAFTLLLPVKISPAIESKGLQHENFNY